MVRNATVTVMLPSKAFPIWKQAHAAAERLLTGCSADDLRSALRALS